MVSQNRVVDTTVTPNAAIPACLETLVHATEQTSDRLHLYKSGMGRTQTYNSATFDTQKTWRHWPSSEHAV
jgi:hypothetical protein